MNKILVSIILVILFAVSVISTLIATNVIELPSNKDKSDATIDITTNEDYKSLMSVKTQLELQKNELLSQLATKDAEIANLESDAENNATELQSLKTEKKSLNEEIEVLQLQITDLEYQLSQLNYINGTINDMSIIFDYESLTLANDILACMYTVGTQISGFDLEQNFGDFTSFELFDSYRVELGNASSGFMLSKCCGNIIDSTTSSIKFVNTDFAEIIPDRMSTYEVVSYAINYEYYTVEELAEFDLSGENILKTFECTIVLNTI